MNSVLGTGLIFIMIGAIGYVSWTRPRRLHSPKDYALATIRMSQAAIGIGVLLTVIGLVGTLARWFF